jgi:hypothetical protein
MTLEKNLPQRGSSIEKGVILFGEMRFRRGHFEGHTETVTDTPSTSLLTVCRKTARTEHESICNGKCGPKAFLGQCPTAVHTLAILTPVEPRGRRKRVAPYPRGRLPTAPVRQR